MNKKLFLILMLIFGIHLFLLINLQFTAWPEMLSYPYLRNNGYHLYKDMIHPYPPVLTIFLSIIYKLFGYKLIVLKIVTWTMILVSDALVFLIAKKFSNKVSLAFISLAVYIFLQPFLEGNMLWFDLAIVPFVLFGTLMLLNKKYFLSGISFAVAALTKQTSALFIIASFIYIFYKTKDIKKVLVFISGPIVLGLTLLIRLITEGAVEGFLNWTLIYPFTYWSKFPGYVQMELSKTQLATMILISLPAIFLITKKKFNFVIVFYLISLILIYPRFSFFHFQLGIALSVVLLSASIESLKKKYLLISLFLAIIFFYISPPILKANWQKETRFWSKKDIYDAQTIKDIVKNGEKTFLLGPHSGLYVLSETLPPKPWTDNFGWYLEIPIVQQDIIKRWSHDLPEYVFVTDQLPGNKFDLGTYRPSEIVKWINDQKIKTVRL